MTTTVGEYLAARLKQIGVDEIFGVPGDFVIGWMDQTEKKNTIKLINTCNELNAAYAADGYARIKGIGALVTTFGVGELSAINGVAGSFAESIPVIAITGAPSTRDMHRHALLHHTTGDYDAPRKMFERVTVYNVMLKHADHAPAQIDKAIVACLTKQKPVYIGLPADLVQAICKAPEGELVATKHHSNESALEEAINEAAELLNKSKKPIIIGDAEVIRYGLQKEFAALLEQTGYPYTSLMLGKTLLDEDHPQFIGIYMGNSSRKYVQDRIEEADAVLALGLVLSDLNSGGFTVNLKTERTISASPTKVRIHSHWYHSVYMRDFITGLTKKLQKRDPSTLDIHPATSGCVHRRTLEFKSEDKQITANRFFDRIAHSIPEGAIVIAETGVSMFGVAEILMPKKADVIAQVFYGSIGYTVGATLGAAMAAKDRPVILFIGDGSLQVTVQDISTMLRNDLKPIIYVLNNDGYTIERLIIDGNYNNIQPWKYHKLIELFGGNGKSWEVRKELELEDALKNMKNDQLNLVEVHMDRMDATDALKKAGQNMASQSVSKK